MRTYTYVYVRITFVYELKIRTYIDCIYKDPKKLSNQYTYVYGTNSRKLFIYFPTAEAAAETEPQQHTAVWQQRPAGSR